MPKYWIGVASHEHVKKGITEGIAQVCHGKQTPLKRIKQDDWIIYYSPTEKFDTKEPCQKFTAIGQISDTEPYQVKMSDDFTPWRRNVNFESAHEVAIEPLIDKLSFIKNKQHWGFIFRFGLFELPYEDFKIIASAMGISTNEKN